jgi:hypothetical protein
MPNIKRGLCDNGSYAPNLSLWKGKVNIFFNIASSDAPSQWKWNKDMPFSGGTYIDARRSAGISLKAPSARSRSVSVDTI